MNADRILLAHGSGGKLSAELIRRVFVPAFGNPALNRMDDSAVLDLGRQLSAISYQHPAPGLRLSGSVGQDGRAPDRARDSGPGTRGGADETAAPPTAPGIQDSGLGTQDSGLGTRLALTTDCHVVKPLFFDGGDIGRLAVCGTVNDLAMVGATPLYLTAGFVLEEGLPVATLERVVASMKAAMEEAGVAVVAGDTKVVEQGSADGLFITTSGVGLVAEGISVSGSRARPGDRILLSGTIGDHGIAVLSRREGLEFGAPVASDVAPLNHLVRALLEAVPRLRCLRDPTRGGLATTLNELAAQSGVALLMDEEQIPVCPAVQAACEMLGYDPLYVANEGKLVAIVPPEEAEAALAALRATRYGEEARIIGTAMPGPAGRVLMKTRIGGTRVVQMLMGEMLPRIC